MCHGAVRSAGWDGHYKLWSRSFGVPLCTWNHFLEVGSGKVDSKLQNHHPYILHLNSAESTWECAFVTHIWELARWSANLLNFCAFAVQRNVLGAVTHGVSPRHRENFPLPSESWKKSEFLRDVKRTHGMPHGSSSRHNDKVCIDSQ